MNKQSYELGTIEASEQLIHDRWASSRKICFATAFMPI